MLSGVSLVLWLPTDSS